MVIVKCDNQEFNLQVISLNNWYWRTKELLSLFDSIVITSIYHELDLEVGSLSKETLKGEVGFLHMEELVDNSMENGGFIHFFFM